MKVNRYRIKDDVRIQEILDNGFKYSANRQYLSKFVTLKDSIVMYVRIPLRNRYSFDDFRDIDVLDDDFCQPYTPFYGSYDKEVVTGGFLAEVIRRYHEVMDKIDVFEKV